VETQKDEAITENAIVGLAAAPDGICFSATQTGLLKSNDFGETWDSAFASLPASESIPVTAVALSPSFDADGTVFAAIPGGIGRSRDRGEQWEFVALPLPIQIISAFAISPDFAHDHIVFASTTDDGVLRSEDGSLTWQAWNFGLLDHNVLSLAISPSFAVDRTILAGTSTGSFRSTNAGKSWQAIELDRGFAEITSLVSASNSTYFAIADDSSLYRSTDSGSTWTDMHVSATTIKTITPGPDFIVITTDETVLRSKDLGESWERIAPSHDSNTSATLIDDHRMLIGTASGEFRNIGLSAHGGIFRG
jgi:photosystem II stability/assembly factor-like uncharacterized protein